MQTKSLEQQRRIHAHRHHQQQDADAGGQLVVVVLDLRLVVGALWNLGLILGSWYAVDFVCLLCPGRHLVHGE